MRDHARCGIHRKLRRREEAKRRRRVDRVAQAFYTSAKWRAVRSRFAAKNPLCERCAEEGETVPVEVVHHVVPISEGGDMYSFDNLESLCHLHHNREHAGSGEDEGGKGG